MAGASVATVTGCPGPISSLSNFRTGSHRFRGGNSALTHRALSTRLLSSKEWSAVRFSRRSRNVTCKISEDVLIEGRGRQQDSGNSELPRTEISHHKQSKSKDHMDGRNITFPFYSHISSAFVDALERGLLWAFSGFSKPTNYYLLGNYAPVDEFGPEPVRSVTGNLPECLNGEFMLIGPNPKFKPVWKYHMFDGDGMVHGLRIKAGKVTYCCRYVRTLRLQQEEYWGGAKLAKLGDLEGVKGLIGVAFLELRGRLGLLDVSRGMGTANTAFAYHNGQLLALNEIDLPYVVRVLDDGSFDTVSQLDYDKKLDHPFTAHPKIDPVTGEMFAFGYDAQALPHLTYRAISKDGVMGHSVPITISRPVMIHDFAITENYAVLIDAPLCFSPKEMVKENQFIYSFDKSSPIRFGVLPRYAQDESQMQWFDCSSGYIFHAGNAWEEADEVVLIACRHDEIDLTAFSNYDKDKCDATKRYLWEYRFNLETGKAQERRLGEFHVEFPRINQEYTGRKSRYVYTAVFQDTTHIIGIAKFDLTKEPELGKVEVEVGGNVAGVIWHGSMRFGSEPVYVPKYPGMVVDEDDGYLLCFVFDENTGKSELIVIDAKTMSSDPVAVVELPSRVPYGFHSLFLTEEQLQLQKS